jgi:mono/diheme cytochrome c family protein
MPVTLRSRRAAPSLVALLCGSLVACSPQGDGTVRAESASAMPGDPLASAPAVERGRYLVEFGGCHDCHTPKNFTDAGPAFDSTRLLSGHRADVTLPPVPPGVLGPDRWGAVASPEFTAWAGPWGVSYAANLTPDETGLGAWNADQFVQTMRTGKHMGTGRAILPPMPWQQVGRLTDDDLRAVFAYLQSIPPVSNAVPLPVPPARTAAR